MNFLNLILPPILGGLIALSTNWLAIVMLFRPHTEKRIFGIRVPFTPGLIPRGQARLAKKLSEAIAARLLTPEVLAGEFSDMLLRGVGSEKLKSAADEFQPDITAAIAAFIDKPEIDARLAEFTYKIIDENAGGLTKLFISKEKIYNSLKAAAKNYLTESPAELQTQVHAAIDAVFSRTEKNSTDDKKLPVENILKIFAEYLAANIPVQTMIERRIEAINIAEMEEIILSVARRELRLIVLLGGALGFLVGLLVIFI